MATKQLTADVKINVSDVTQNGENMKRGEGQPLVASVEADEANEKQQQDKNYLNLLKLKEEIEASTQKSSLCSQLKGCMCRKPEKPKELGLVISVVILFIIIVVSLAVIFRFYEEDLYYEYNKENFTVNGKSLDIVFKDKLGQHRLKGQLWRSKEGDQLPFECSTSLARSDNDICLEWRNSIRLNIEKRKSPDAVNKSDTTCYDVSWTPLSARQKGSSNDVTREMADCYHLDEGVSWFGLGLLGGQGWPLNSISFPKQAYLTSDPFSSSVFSVGLEPYLISSSGITLNISTSTPLHVSLEGNSDVSSKRICFYATNLMTSHNDSSGLKYSVCMADSVIKANADSTFVYANETSSSTVPFDISIMDNPIWSTEDYLGRCYDEKSILDFASRIKKNSHIFGEPHLILIDGGWESQYGDFTFDSRRFPNPEELLDKLKGMGFRVGLWVSIMVAASSQTFEAASGGVFLGNEVNDDVPQLVKWWNGPHEPRWQLPLASIINISSPASWHHQNTTILQKKYNIQSLQHGYGFSEAIPSHSASNDPNLHTNLYTRSVQPGSIVNSVYKNQMDGAILRLTGAVSKWSGRNSLSAVISDALSLGLFGYPLFIPQSVGGAQYSGSGISKELYLRWFQVAVFMPVLHLSTPPDIFDNETVSVVRELMLLRSQTILPELKRSAGFLVRGSARSLVKPLWMVVEDADAVSIHDQFIVGDRILVAPVLAEGKLHRDVYIPRGLWDDRQLDTIHVGPKLLKEYAAGLNVVPYFIKK